MNPHGCSQLHRLWGTVQSTIVQTCSFDVGCCMDTNTRQIALSVLENLREELAYARLNNGSPVLDVADLRQYIYEQMGRIRMTDLVMAGLCDISKSNGRNGKAHLDKNWHEREQH